MWLLRERPDQQLDGLTVGVTTAWPLVALAPPAPRLDPGGIGRAMGPDAM